MLVSTFSFESRQWSGFFPQDDAVITQELIKSKLTDKSYRLSPFFTDTQSTWHVYRCWNWSLNVERDNKEN